MIASLDFDPSLDLRVACRTIGKEEKDSARAEARKDQIGSGDRSQKVRTYNFPENRVSDHRINLTLYSLDKIIAGDKLDEVITSLIAEDQARKLAAMDENA